MHLRLAFGKARIKSRGVLSFTLKPAYEDWRPADWQRYYTTKRLLGVIPYDVPVEAAHLPEEQATFVRFCVAVVSRIAGGRPLYLFLPHDEPRLTPVCRAHGLEEPEPGGGVVIGFVAEKHVPELLNGSLLEGWGEATIFACPRGTANAYALRAREARDMGVEFLRTECNGPVDVFHLALHELEMEGFLEVTDEQKTAAIITEEAASWPAFVVERAAD